MPVQLRLRKKGEDRRPFLCPASMHLPLAAQEPCADLLTNEVLEQGRILKTLESGSRGSFEIIVFNAWYIPVSACFCLIAVRVTVATIGLAGSFTSLVVLRLAMQCC